MGVLVSWLQARRGRVVVDGCFSDVYELANMVFQDRVLGLLLWNLFYGDAGKAVRSCGFKAGVCGRPQLLEVCPAEQKERRSFG